MRIENANRPQLASALNSKKTSGTAEAARVQFDPMTQDTRSRVQRLESLREQIRAGNPINVNQLADKLAGSGIPEINR